MPKKRVVGVVVLKCFTFQFQIFRNPSSEGVSKHEPACYGVWIGGEIKTKTVSALTWLRLLRGVQY